MPVSDLSKVISSAVVPVVIISSCGLLALAFYNRLAAIVSRLRAFQRERLLEHERIEADKSRHGGQVLENLQLQTVRVKRRANLIRWTLLFLLLTIGLLICCCMMLALAALAPEAMYAAITLFFLGLLSMLCATITAALELKDALEPIELESQFVSEVVEQQSPRDESAV
jgi:hypothetical protein